MPDNLGRLTNLRTLIVGLKTVKAIPEPILQLTALESLAITFCKLQRLPCGVAAMTNLRALSLQGNPGLAVSNIVLIFVAVPFLLCCSWLFHRQARLAGYCEHGGSLER